MTKTELIALIDANGGDDCLNGLMFDNSMNTNFNSGRPFDRNTMLVTIGGIDYFKLDTRLRSKENGTYCIEGFNYHPLEFLQAIDFVKKPHDQDKIDIWEVNDIG